MRKWLMISVVVSGAVTSAYSVQTVHKVGIAALAKDAALSTEVEAGLKQHFAEKGVQAVSLHTLYKSTVSVSQMTEQLRAQGYDSLFCISPRKTIRLITPASASAETDMRSCLTTYVTGAFPTGDPLDVAPLAEDPKPSNTSSQETLRGPIPSNPQAAAYRVNKGILRVFDLASGKLVWEGQVQVKMPPDLQTELQVKLIIHDVWEIIAKSGLLPAP